MKKFFLFFFLLFLLSCSNTNNKEIERLTKINEKYDSDLFILKQAEQANQEILRRTIKYSGEKIESKSIFWGRDSLNTFTLNELAVKPRLIFCFSTNTCSPCVESAIEFIKEVFPDYTENEMIIITGDYPLRLRDSVYGKKMLSGITLPINEIEVPFFFILDKKMEVSLLHLFNKLNPDITKVYLEEIKKKYD
ncbi:MAG: hypothetical protein LBE91_02275 [Tannerella sp.]|jgi:hypothetical protein|nr:hypothetical protein [Tannerella sp.]